MRLSHIRTNNIAFFNMKEKPTKSLKSTVVIINDSVTVTFFPYN